MASTTPPAGRQDGTKVPGQPYLLSTSTIGETIHIKDCGVSLFIFHSQI
jgi:hypothetical protein